MVEDVDDEVTDVVDGAETVDVEELVTEVVEV